MEEYPDKSKYDKLSRRKYFTGNKTLKYVKMFENFDQVNEVRVKSVAATTSNIPKDLKDLITIVMQSTESIDETSAKLEKELAALKIKKAVVENQKNEIMKMLKDVKATSVEVNTILGKISVKIEPKTKMTKTSVQYKEVAESLKDFLPKTKKMEETVANIYAAFTKNPEEVKWDELTLTAIKAAKKNELVAEGLTDTVKSLWGKFVNFIKGIFGQVKETSKEYTDSGDKLAELLRQMEEKYYEPTVAEGVNETLDIHNTMIKDVIKDTDGNKWEVVKTSLGGATLKNTSTDEEKVLTWKEMHGFGEKVQKEKPKEEPKPEDGNKGTKPEKK